MNDLKRLYDVGYQEVKFDLLEKVLKYTGAVLVDVRFAPTSGNAAFRKETLQKNLGSAYEHVHDLGNANYRGVETVIVNLEAGCKRVVEILKNRPAILMCACWKRSECHRMNAVNFLSDMYAVHSVPLTRALCKDIVDQNEPTQFGLFDEAEMVTAKIGNTDPRTWMPDNPESPGDGTITGVDLAQIE